MRSYAEALAFTLDAVGRDGDLEAALALVPERYHRQLREDAGIAEVLRHTGRRLPPPAPSQAHSASQRLHAELRSVSHRPHRRWRRLLDPPRLAFAAAVIAVALVGVRLALPSGSGHQAEAATLQGVVVETSSESLTVQTPRTLEKITVPKDAFVADDSGTVINLSRIEPGEVVVIQGNRREQGEVAARSVSRATPKLESWCAAHAEPCRNLLRRLELTRQRCAHSPDCSIAAAKLLQAIERVQDSGVDELLQVCAHEADGCKELDSFCLSEPGICLNGALPPATDETWMEGQ